VRAGVAEAHGSGGAGSVAAFGASTSTTMELAWRWKVDEAPVAQLTSRAQSAEERGGHEERMTQRGSLRRGARSGYRFGRGRRMWATRSCGRWEPVGTSGETAAPALPRFR
jgi:hypothetical protein